jgi:cysteine desulfurase
VTEIAKVCRAAGVPVHTDAAQVAGKLPVDFRQLGVTTMSIAGHKLHGPLGIGALVVRHGARLVADLFGGPQQGELRPGTEPVALAVGLRQALELWHADRDGRAQRLAALRDRFETAIVARWPDAVILGQGAPRLPHVSNIALVGTDRQAMFMALDQAGVACSTGSACASGSSELSPVHVAMGCPPPVASSALRFSFGVPTTIDEVDEAATRILRVARSLPPAEPRR